MSENEIGKPRLVSLFLHILFKSFPVCGLVILLRLLLYIERGFLTAKMMVYNHRLVEGTPLQYYVPPLVPPPFPYFKRFEVHTTPEMNEEMLPPSPHSTQVITSNPQGRNKINNQWFFTERQRQFHFQCGTNHGSSSKVLLEVMWNLLWVAGSTGNSCN